MPGSLSIVSELSWSLKRQCAKPNIHLYEYILAQEHHQLNSNSRRDSCFTHFFGFLIRWYLFSKLEAFFVDMFQECLTFQSALVAVTSVNQLDRWTAWQDVLLCCTRFFRNCFSSWYTVDIFQCTALSGNPGLESLMPPTTLSSNLCQRALFSWSRVRRPMTLACSFVLDARFDES